uniref:Uncharacterized protein n=1 Tax=Tanacetum cinerariifolium TaxID=118510 RepID=A0A6L2LWI7_TANCI|nr:hypothetical protein [Tanacetum cinerariifolium]
MGLTLYLGIERGNIACHKSEARFGTLLREGRLASRAFRDEAFWRSQVNFGPPNPATDEKALWYGVKGSVYVVTLPAFQRCLEDGPDAAERRPGSGFPTGGGAGDGHLKAHHDIQATPARPGKATRLGVRGSIGKYAFGDLLKTKSQEYVRVLLQVWDDPTSTNMMGYKAEKNIRMKPEGGDVVEGHEEAKVSSNSDGSDQIGQRVVTSRRREVVKSDSETSEKNQYMDNADKEINQARSQSGSPEEEKYEAHISDTALKICDVFGESDDEEPADYDAAQTNVEDDANICTEWKREQCSSASPFCLEKPQPIPNIIKCLLGLGIFQISDSRSCCASHEAGVATTIINIGKTKADNFLDLKINTWLEEICFRTTIIIEPPVYLNPDCSLLLMHRYYQGFLLAHLVLLSETLKFKRDKCTDITTASVSRFFTSKINSHALANKAYISGRNQELEKYWYESQVMAPRPRGPDNCADEFMLF